MRYLHEQDKRVDEAMDRMEKKAKPEGINVEHLRPKKERRS